ncbi:MAG: alpha/beta hydrolase [Actinomycetota bacterium]
MTGLVWVALALAAILGVLYLFQRSLIYLPSQNVPDAPEGVLEVTYETEDELTLSGWFVRSSDNRGSVIVFNGNAGNRANRLPLGQALAEAGYSVLLTDYRGYGGNRGTPSEKSLALDARAAFDYLADRVGTDRLVYYGESLGAGVAIGLAAEKPPAALILRSPFTSLADVASAHYPFLPTSLLLIDRYQNSERIGDVQVPTLFVAGTDDTIVPADQTRRLYEAASEPKDLLMVEGAGHNDRALLDGDDLVETLVEFLDRVVP